MADLSSFHLLDDGHTIAVRSDIVQQMTEDGLDVKATVVGLFTTSVQTDGPINEEYCWIHDPGGWSCPLCRVESE